MRLYTLIAVLPLAACSYGSNANDGKPGLPGSGSGTTRTFTVIDFDQVDLRGSDDVDVRVGTGFSVRAEGASEELDKLRIEKVGSTLKVGRINGAGFSWGGKHDGVKVFVTMPRIVQAGIAGSGNLSIDRVEGQSFTGETAGSGNLAVAALNVQTGTFSVAGSGDMNLTGIAKHLSMKIAGSGDIDAGGVKAQDASVSVTGSGNARADVTGPANVSVTGSGEVELGKGANCTTSKTGSGEVRCG